MGFREDLSADVSTVFLCEGEFGEPHTVNGVALTAVLEDAQDALDGVVKGDFQDTTALALVAHRTTLRIKSGVLDPMPVPEEEITLDGKKYLVEKVTPQLGMVDITLFHTFA